jgi:hypothetical protein
MSNTLTLDVCITHLHLKNGVYSSEQHVWRDFGADNKTWNRIIRFVSADGRVLLGEPKDLDLDIGLALAEDRRVDVYVLSGEHIWDLHVIRTGEEAVVKKVRTSLVVPALC